MRVCGNLSTESPVVHVPCFVFLPQSVCEKEMLRGGNKYEENEENVSFCFRVHNFDQD